MWLTSSSRCSAQSTLEFSTPFLFFSLTQEKRSVRKSCWLCLSGGSPRLSPGSCSSLSSVLPASALLPTVHSQASCQSDPVLRHVKPCYFCARNHLISFSFTQRKNQRPCYSLQGAMRAPLLPLVTSMTSFTPSSFPGLQPSLLLLEHSRYVPA